MHILVTGASSGIGLAIARELDHPDHRLSLVARRKALLDELRGKMQGQTQAIEADLSRPEGPDAWLGRAEADFGPIDILVNNAGVSYIEPIAGIDDERSRILFQVNVHTPIATIHRTLPAMVARGSGTIVNVASNVAFSPAPYLGHYAASKAALGAYSESLRMEIRKRGVNVVTVYPGPVDTPMAERNWGQLKETRASRLAPEGDAATLARLVHAAIRRRRARVIYPRFYRLAWWMPGIGRWVAERFVPEATGATTPPMGGDALAGKDGGKPAI